MIDRNLTMSVAYMVKKQQAYLLPEWIDGLAANENDFQYREI